jgi:phosphoglycerate dehydrogenase-like enzyme
VRLVQSVATGVELFDLAALPAGITVCNAFGHETAIAEYVVMTMLALHHRLFEIAREFRESSLWRSQCGSRGRVWSSAQPSGKGPK